MQADVIVIGSGIGGLTAAALLARYGKSVIVCESHAIPGGAAHGFSRQGFLFDSGPSFFAGLSDSNSLNPLRQVLEAIGETVAAVPYEPFGYYHFPEGTFAVYGNSDRYKAEIAKVTLQGAQEYTKFERELLRLYDRLRQIPAMALRADFNLIPFLLSRYPAALLNLLPQLAIIQASVGNVARVFVHDRWVQRLIDLECFLLSGLKADGTVAPEMAFMLGERTHSAIDYPIGGSDALVQALIRGLERWGGTLRLNAHVEQILVERGRVSGVQLRRGEVLHAPIVISNATIWDTYTQLLKPTDLPPAYRQRSLNIPVVDSFMHLHLGIRADGLNALTGHHVVVHDAAQDITVPGNTCMISIPSVWDAKLAPPGHHVVHAYTLEPFAGWQRDEHYDARKRDRSQSLYRALERIIPDVRQRIVLELIGTPLTHAHYLRRHQGTYGPAIAAGKGMFPSTHTPIAGLYRVGDSTIPGIGVPAVAASGILCANTIVSPQQVAALLKQSFNSQKILEN
ncbi:phytoene desaturase family protein [Thermocoleostomius sinensis]|uniref:NAD(P)/FAD-dependent oxidoreductase n=1 Tax=Thermocoleostomius sinensis A174 TaxID=2016057 RepID=A0A9E8ZC77_9CYAN|nr:NAD(P)/FAD-dependent oxidoreductase [Thermocoleostomius sinensis]WAL59172.1 NAD(P)/FAD-dependent oxidoreductase [Thermocoleostomius sinensis A174]